MQLTVDTYVYTVTGKMAASTLVMPIAKFSLKITVQDWKFHHAYSISMPN
jgi:hypothetical protein